MRRAQSVRHYARPSLALGADDLGMLKESPDESIEDVLRRQLLEKDRENDKLQTQIQTLQAQLAQRPPLEAVQAMQKEHTNLEILLQGTQRENERCMAELERERTRQKMLERELERLAGANWQANLDITSSSAVPTRHRSGTQSSIFAQAQASKQEASTTQIEQVRLLILGMEQRLQSREEKLLQTVEHAEAEGSRFEEMRKQALTA
ncbi:hypothetical protein BKA93DRAFT_781660 [Sparassis latifolia]|uniref:Uncharacterized protein n=1 Tax=Sparassis crispa TaxID=139825 RepID=A0A401G5Z5_9APHY|nr:hypothetical protein SCP_0104720 [Sparassis crispa]GBE77592.1 hypothetical protein SCP_0104720 [Sparassis crispa]